jgi:hypothetical protein
VTVAPTDLPERVTVTPTRDGARQVVSGRSPADVAALVGRLLPQLAQEAQRGQSWKLTLGPPQSESRLGAVDHVVDALPGAIPQRADPLWVAVGGVLVSLFACAGLALLRPR